VKEAAPGVPAKRIWKKTEKFPFGPKRKSKINQENNQGGDSKERKRTPVGIWSAGKNKKKKKKKRELHRKDKKKKNR